MKFVLCLLVLLPFVCCEEERFIVDTFSHLSFQGVVDALKAALGSDATEAACELACPSILSAVPGGSLVAPLLCHPGCVEAVKLINAGK